MAGGGLNGAHSCLVHPSQLAGMWNEMGTNSWPFMKMVWPSAETTAGAAAEEVRGSGAFSSGLRDSPSPAYRI